MELLRQVNLVHYEGRPDIFKMGTKYTPEELKEILADPNRPILVYTDEGDEVLGYAFCLYQQHLGSNLLTDIKTLYIDDLCVDEGMRGQGIATALYRFVTAYANETNCTHITLNVWRGNESAQRFYEKMGMNPRNITMEMKLC